MATSSKPPEDRRAEELVAQRDVLRRELLRPGLEPVCPGIFAGDSGEAWVPGITLDNAIWMPDPQQLSRLMLATVLGVDRPPSGTPALVERQQREWGRDHLGRHDPIAAWTAVPLDLGWGPLRLDDPLVVLLVTDALDCAAVAHAQAVETAREFCWALSEAIRGLETLRRRVRQLPSPLVGYGFIIGSFERLFRLESKTVVEQTLFSAEVTELLATLNVWATRLEAIAAVTTAFRPPPLDPREKPWRRPAWRLAALFEAGGCRRSDIGLNLALVAALERYGHDLEPGSLDEKVERVRKALGRERVRIAKRTDSAEP